MLYKAILHRNRCYDCDKWLYLLTQTKYNIHCTLQCAACGSKISITLIELDKEFQWVGNKEINEILYGL